MLNPERLLGHLLSGGLRGRRLRNRAALGVGLMGVALAAYEHFSQQKQAATDSPPGSTAGPPAPPQGQSAPPPPPPARESQSEQAILLIQGMVAAAHADGHLDASERQRIEARCEEAGLSPEERTLLEQEIGHPVPLDQLASAARLHGVEGPLYAVSLMAIDPDSEAERTYLKDLGQALALDPHRIQRIHEELGA